MLKNRLIFTLLYSKGKYMLSRNFSLQSVGDIAWLKNHYDYNSMAYAIDELVVLNVERDRQGLDDYCAGLRQLAGQYFMPLAAGGGIRSMQDAEKMIAAGADKLVVCTSLYDNPDLVRNLARVYGSQSIVACLDYRVAEGLPRVFKDNGRISVDLDLITAAKHAEVLGVGEVFLNSINQDGTGEGFDWNNVSAVRNSLQIPVIASGGAGRYDHFVRVFEECGVKAAATADLFNFMSDALIECRTHIVEAGIPMAKWDVSLFSELRGEDRPDDAK